MDEFTPDFQCPPPPDWHQVAVRYPWLRDACRCELQEASKPPTWSTSEILAFLSTLRHHQARHVIRAFLLDLVADELAEIILAATSEVRS